MAEPERKVYQVSNRVLEIAKFVADVYNEILHVAMLLTDVGNKVLHVAMLLANVDNKVLHVAKLLADICNEVLYVGNKVLYVEKLLSFLAEFPPGVPVAVTLLEKRVTAIRRLLCKVQINGGPVSLLGILILGQFFPACLDEFKGLGDIWMLRRQRTLKDT